MTERKKTPALKVASTTTALIERIADKHVEIALLMRKLGAEADARNMLLRRDMVGGDDSTLKEAQRIFDLLQADVHTLATQLSELSEQLPELAAAAATVKHFDDELALIKDLVAGSEDDADGGSG